MEKSSSLPAKGLLGVGVRCHHGQETAQRCGTGCSPFLLPQPAVGRVPTPPPAPGALPTQGGGEHTLCPFPPEEPHPGEPRFHLRRLQLAALHPSAPLRRRILTPIRPRGSSVPGKIKTNHIWKTYLHQKNAGETSSCAQAGTGRRRRRRGAPKLGTARTSSRKNIPTRFGLWVRHKRVPPAGCRRRRDQRAASRAAPEQRRSRSGLWLSVSAWVGSGHRLGLEETAA